LMDPNWFSAALTTLPQSDGPPPPIALSIDPARLGCAVLLTSACWDLEEQADDEGGVSGSVVSEHLFVHGGPYRHQSEVPFTVVHCSSEVRAHPAADIHKPGSVFEAEPKHTTNVSIVMELQGEPRPIDGISFALTGTDANPRMCKVFCSNVSAGGPWREAWRFEVGSKADSACRSTHITAGSWKVFEDFLECLRDIAHKVSSRLEVTWHKIFDTNDEGESSYSEFVEGCHGVQELSDRVGRSMEWMNDLQGLFRFLDEDDTGVITLDDLMRVSTLKERPPEARWWKFHIVNNWGSIRRLQVIGPLKLFVTGQAVYREQALLGVELVATALEAVGVPPVRIHHWDFADGTSGDANILGDLRDILRRLPANIPDAFVYYVGPATVEGTWAMTWRDQQGQLHHRLLQPDGAFDPPEECMLPPPEASAPGSRMIVADAPFTARSWMRPAVRQRGLAGWESTGLASTERGPALTRWLVGQFARPPPDAVVFPTPPPDAGLCRLPGFRPLLWSPLPSPDVASKLVWELEEFLGAPTQHERRMAANLELLVHGGAALLSTLLVAHGAVADDALLLHILWVLHSLVLSTPLACWVGTMDELFLAALALPRARSPCCSPAVLASALTLAAACAAKCGRSKEQCGGNAQPLVQALILEALGGEDGPNAADVVAAAAGCRLAAQLTSHIVLDVTMHVKLLAALQLALCREPPAQGATAAVAAEQDLRTAAGEALLFTCLRSNPVKLKVLKFLGSTGRLLNLLQICAVASCGKLLAVLRSVACAEPLDAVLEGLNVEIAAVVVDCLNKFPKDPAVQRWGFAALGALVVASKTFAERAGRGAGTCIMATLNSDVLANNVVVQQEALFCAHAMLLRGQSGLEGGRRSLAGQTARVISVSLRAEGKTGTECTAWGLKVLERVACAPKLGPAAVEPVMGVVVEAMLSPHLSFASAEAGSATISYLVAGSETAKLRLKRHKVQLVKAVQVLVWALNEAEGKGCDKGVSLQGWIGVLCDVLGEPRAPLDDDEGMVPVEKFVEEEEAQVGAMM